MRESIQNNPQHTNPLFPKMQNITDFLNLPFIEVLKLLMKGALEDYLTTMLIKRLSLPRR